MGGLDQLACGLGRSDRADRKNAKAKHSKRHPHDLKHVPRLPIYAESAPFGSDIDRPQPQFSRFPAAFFRHRRLVIRRLYAGKPATDAARSTGNPQKKSSAARPPALKRLAGFLFFPHGLADGIVFNSNDTDSHPSRGRVAASRRRGALHLGTRHAEAPRPLSRRAQPRAARGGRDARRAAARAGGRRHRQDPRAHHPHRPYLEPRPRAAFANPRRYLHQQGGARDEGPRGRADRRRGRRHALARHLPRHRRQDPAPSCRARRSQAVLHRARHRRPDQAAEAAARGGEHRREALAGAGARVDDRRLEEQGAGAEARARGRELRLRQRQGARPLRALSAALEGTERRRFRRSPAREFAAVPGAPRRARKISAALPVHAGGRISGLRTSPNICGSGCSRRATATSAASATTTSRSMAGAAPRSTTS